MVSGKLRTFFAVQRVEGPKGYPLNHRNAAALRLGCRCSACTTSVESMPRKTSDPMIIVLCRENVGTWSASGYAFRAYHEDGSALYLGDEDQDALQRRVREHLGVPVSFRVEPLVATAPETNAWCPCGAAHYMSDPCPTGRVPHSAKKR